MSNPFEAITRGWNEVIIPALDKLSPEAIKRKEDSILEDIEYYMNEADTLDESELSESITSLREDLKLARDIDVMRVGINTLLWMEGLYRDMKSDIYGNPKSMAVK